MTEYDIEESTHNNLTCYDAAPWSYLKFSKKIDYWLLMCLWDIEYLSISLVVKICLWCKYSSNVLSSRISFS